MMLFTHMIAAITFLSFLNYPLNVLNILLAIFGSALPDLDLRISFLKRRYGHRTLTHSISIMIPGLLFPSAFGIGLVMHIIMDLFTISGVCILFPRKEKYCLLPLVRTGSWHELVIIALCIGLTIANELFL